MFNERTEDIQKQLSEYKKNMDKKLKKTQNQLNELRISTNSKLKLKRLFKKR
jgi:hypothetical protein